jgi:hypothetical protein
MSIPKSWTLLTDSSAGISDEPHESILAEGRALSDIRPTILQSIRPVLHKRKIPSEEGTLDLLPFRRSIETRHHLNIFSALQSPTVPQSPQREVF